MYESFFGFSEKPFNMTPDPRFLYLSEKHREALALLTYGIQERKGFVVLSGDVGTGKTTVVRALLERGDENFQVAYIFYTKLSVTEFLGYVCRDLGLEVNGRSKIDYLIRLQDFLIESHDNGKTTTLIVDEAQNLDGSLFEEIRMLTNLETSHEKLLQILLVGQPELNDLLDQSELWQLKQRIGARHHLYPLDQKEAKEYIQTRMRIAGAKRLNHFTDEAIRRIYEYSQGIPRIINNVCDNSLLTGYATDTQIVDEAIVEQSIQGIEPNGKFEKEMRARRTPIIKTRRPYASLAFFLIVSCALLALLVVFVSGKRSSFGLLSFRHLSEIKALLTGEKTRLLREELAIKQEKEKTRPLNGELAGKPVGKNVRPVGEELAARYEQEGASQSVYEPTVKNNVPVLVVTVQKGDTVRSLLEREFGKSDKVLMAAVRKLNPEIQDLNWINVGQKIRLPLSLEAAYEIQGIPG